MIRHEHILSGSFYGKFFARKLNLHLLQRNVDAWKDFQSSTKAQSSPAVNQHPSLAFPEPAPSHKTDNPLVSTNTKSDKRKRKTRPQDEIDELFEGALGKKIKKADLGSTDRSVRTDTGLLHDKIADKSLMEVLGAIRAAPKEDKAVRKKRAL